MPGTTEGEGPWTWQLLGKETAGCPEAGRALWSQCYQGHLNGAASCLPSPNMGDPPTALELSDLEGAQRSQALLGLQT